MIRTSPIARTGTLTRKAPLPRAAAPEVGKPRQKSCKVCRSRFEPRTPLQVACGLACAIADGKKTTAIQKAKAKKIERAEDKAKLEAMKTRNELIAEAQQAFNLVVRLEGAALPCISCGATNPPARGLTGGVWDAGHYLSRGSACHLRFDRRNVHKQCKGCNRPGGATRAAHRAGVEARIGREALEALESDQASREYTHDDLRAIRDTCRKRAAQLKKELA